MEQCDLWCEVFRYYSYMRETVTSECIKNCMDTYNASSKMGSYSHEILQENCCICSIRICRKDWHIYIYISYCVGYQAIWQVIA